MRDILSRGVFPFSWPPVSCAPRCRPRCRSELCPRPCYVARLFAVCKTVERYAVFKVLHLSFYICTGGLELQKTTSIEKYILFLPVAKKRKSAAQNRTRTTNCPNSVSYGAWKIFSPYGSCSACTIRNRWTSLLNCRSLRKQGFLRNCRCIPYIFNLLSFYFPISIYRNVRIIACF